MELHDHLYALGLQVGREVFDDPEGFRGVLDDFLEEDEATTGDINLLVDAVRLGAFRSMLTMLDSGADAASAVSEAGLRLARDRGSADAGSAQWACAVLGFAVGRVGEADVARFRSSTAPPTPDNGAATELPPVPGPAPVAPPAPPAPPTPPPPSYPAPPAQQPSYPAYQQPSYQQPQYEQAQYEQQHEQPPYQIAPQTQGYPQQSKPRTGLILALVGTAAAVVIAIILALVIAGGGDDDKPEQASSTTQPTTEPTTEPTSEPTTSEPTSDPPSSDPPTTPAVDPGGQVSVGDAGDFTQALLDFSDAFGTASTDLGAATSDNDYDGALEANAAVRKSVYDLDSAVRELDLDAVAPQRDEFLTQSGLMIEGLDEAYTTATTAIDIGLAFGELPLQAYTDSFTELSTAITDSAYS